jgi:hypothetical protein
VRAAFFSHGQGVVTGGLKQVLSREKIVVPPPAIEYVPFRMQISFAPTIASACAEVNARPKIRAGAALNIERSNPGRSFRFPSEELMAARWLYS